MRKIILHSYFLKSITLKKHIIANILSVSIKSSNATEQATSSMDSPQSKVDLIFMKNIQFYSLFQKDTKAVSYVNSTISTVSTNATTLDLCILLFFS